VTVDRAMTSTPERAAAPIGPPASLSTAHVVAEYLKQARIPFIFGYPGTSNIELMEGARQRGVETILARREGTAAFMAEAFGMLTGRPGVCISTLGPGSTSLVNGVAAATLDRAPMIAISGQIGTAREQYFTHQVVAHEPLFAPVTKWTGRIEPGSVGTVMRKALRTAMAERPGAVHLTGNADLARAEAVDAEVAVPPAAAAAVAMQITRSEPARDPVRMLAQARRPVLLAGIGATRQGAGPQLVGLAEAVGMPVVVSPMAKGVFPEEHPYFAGVIDMACHRLLWDLLDSSDLIVAVGFDPVELISAWRLRTPVLHVDALPNTDQIYPADVELTGAVPALVEWLVDGAGAGGRWSERELERHMAARRDAYYGGRVEGALNPTDVVDVLRAGMPRDTLLTTDVGSHKLLFGEGWTTHAPRTFLTSNGLSSMGFSLPAAIAAKLVQPETPVVCTTGDGGFAMVQGELQLAASLGLGLVVVVMCDESLNRIELKQMALGYPSTATRIDATDVVALAGAMGCEGARVTSARELERVLADTRPTDRPLVIEAHIDPAQYEAQF
jgi:acetolactate synthase-1/2/3 large subunit